MKRGRQHQQQQPQRKDTTTGDKNCINSDSHSNDSSMYDTSSSATVYTAGLHNGGSVCRIRTPHKNDVLSGRGGSINQHLGNKKFREWVAIRKNDYNLAANKTEKAIIAREVIRLVTSQSPPGRFLQKDPSTSSSVGGSFWVEIDEERIMAKTSQALREGAPKIRAAHKDEIASTVTPSAVVSAAIINSAPKVLSNHKPTPNTVVSSLIRKAGIAHNVTPRGAAISERNDAAIVSEDQVKPSAQQSLEFPAVKPQLFIAVDELNATVEAAATTTYCVDEQQLPSKRAVEEVTVVAHPPSKRVRVEYMGHAVRPRDSSPQLRPMPTVDGAVGEPALVEQELNVALPPLTLSSQDEEQKTTTLTPAAIPSPSKFSEKIGHRRLERSHSLALSDLSVGDWPNEDFVNVFENEENDWTFALRPGVFRETSVTSDMGGLGALRRSMDLPLTADEEKTNPLNDSVPYPMQNELARHISDTSLRTISNENTLDQSNKSLSSFLADLPDNNNGMEDMNLIYDALKHDDYGEHGGDLLDGVEAIEDDEIATKTHPPAHLKAPTRGTFLQHLRRSNSGTSGRNRSFHGRQ